MVLELIGAGIVGWGLCHWNVVYQAEKDRKAKHMRRAFQEVHNMRMANNEEWKQLEKLSGQHDPVDVYYYANFNRWS